MTGWAKNTEAELRTLLRSHGQPTDGSKAALVQRLTAFLSDGAGEADGDDDDGDERPSASEAAALEAAGANTELEAWRAATTRLREQRATVKAAAAAARAALHAHRVQLNEQSCALLQLVGQADLRPIFMRAEMWGVVGLWRLRGVCRAFRGWARAELSSLSRVVAVGGGVKKWVSRNVGSTLATASVEALDLSTMRWSAAGCMPSLPDPRAYHTVSCTADGRVVVCGGFNYGGADQMWHRRRTATALQWLPGTDVWSALPDLPAGHEDGTCVVLPDGRTMLIGGVSTHNGQALVSVAVLAADGSGWSDLPPLTTGRTGPAAAVLPDGKVLVAGGLSTDCTDTALNTAELWDPATQVWTALPPMTHKRYTSAACVLPSGRVAVVGGDGTDGKARKDGEVYDPVKREWEPLWAEMAHQHADTNLVAVAGGLVAVGGLTPELYSRVQREFASYDVLLAALVDKRKEIGSRTNKLPFHIMPSEQLRALAGNPVNTIDEFKAVQGVGGNRAELYGNEFLAVIKQTQILFENELNANELYDEESGRWFTLPNAMAAQRSGTGLLISLPAAALLPTATDAL
jgi:hypothetical protein